MADTPLIRLDKVSKSYPKVSTGQSRLAALKAALANRPYAETHDILKHIDLQVNPGESLGIIGENGAGKSTLLKLIAGVLRPSQGNITVNGRIAALLELGAGFHPEYSGIENIRMNAALSRLTPDEINGKLEAIIDFADIGDYIYEPVKHYSSGMVVRLGFAMITAFEPELLITDEVLAVGDESFQKKCISWMQRYLDQGGTLLLCSHGMYHIQKLCQKAVWIDHGEIREYGASTTVTQNYLNFHERKQKREQAVQAEPVFDSEHYRVTEVSIVDENDEAIRVSKQGKTFSVKGSVYSPDGRAPNVAIGIYKIDDGPIFGTANSLANQTLTPIDKHHFAFCITYPACPLLAGEFLIKAHAMDPEALRLFDTVEVALTITSETFSLGSVYLEHQWQH